MIFSVQYPEYNTKYSISHILHGAAIAYFRSTFLLWWAIIYQAGQYMSGVRVYIPEQRIRRGHNFKHLVNKITEYLVGYLLVKNLI